MMLKLILSKKSPGLKVFYFESKFIETAIIAPSAVLTTLSGIIMAQLWFGWPAWLTWGLIVVIYTAMTGSIALPRIKKRLTDLIGSNTTPNPEIKRLTIQFILFTGLNIILLISAVGTMIYKPTF